MPEPYWPKRKKGYSISDAMRLYEIAAIRCHYCKTEKFYLLSELKALFGDIEVDDVIYVQRWRCVNCGRTDTMHIDVTKPSAAERQAMTIRRIAQIEYVRKVTWRDE